MTNSNAGSDRKSFISICLCLMLPLAVLVFSCSKEKEYPPKLMFIMGSATLISGEKSSSLEIHSKIKNGDIIVTEKQSYVNLSVGMDSIVKIYENSRFTIKKQSTDLSGNINDSDFNLDSGKIFVIIKRLGKNNSVLINTPTSTLAVRGTEFVVDAFEENKKLTTRLEVVDGAVTIQSATKPDVVENVREGETADMTTDTVKIEKQKIEPDKLELLQDESDILQQKKADGSTSTNDTTGKKEESTAAKTAKPPILKTDRQIKEYYKKLERITLDDKTVLVGAIIQQNKKNVKIHTVNGVITVPASSVVKQEML
jgi:hypothetical protein